MKRLLLIVLVIAGLLAAGFLAPALVRDPGLVLIEFGSWRVEMSLLVLVLGVLVAWLLMSLFTALLRLPGRTLRRARDRRSRRQLENGFLALAEGDWRGAERALRKSLQHQDSPAGYLAAARAAQGQGDSDRRDRWLALAGGRFGRRSFIAGLARARLLIGEGRTTEAVPVLEELHLKKPRHNGVLRLLLEAYQDAARWRDLRLLTPALRRAGVVDRQRADDLAVLAAERELDACVDVAELETVWKELGRRLHRRRELVAAFARRSAELGRPELAAKPLRLELSESLDDELLGLYAKADESERSARIAECEQWLEKTPDHAGLQQTLGMLYLAERRYDEARGCLEQAVRQRPSSEAYEALGRVLDRAGKLEAAAQCYRNALRLRSGRGVEPLPPPE
ncbi:MAG: tetratricopeptide repeat protein [Pseudomonadota bacterium]|nr:MAG: tetratricopeptide repeat protein [Pseudomonadota bacterium]